MTPDQLKQTLDSRYQVLDFVDLADISATASAVYKIFKLQYKETFESSERIIFYSKHTPTNKLLTHIRKAADIVDISHGFILICCPPGNESLFHPDSYDLEYYPVNVSSKILPEDPATFSDTLCPYPWMHLSVMPMGEVRPCCISNDIVGHVNDQSLSDIFYSPDMEQLRVSLLEGERPDGCSNCWTSESQNITSSRQRVLRYFSQKEFYSKWIDQPQITSLDLRPSNVCNFKCRVCSPTHSSLHNAEQLALTTDPEKIIDLKSISAKGKWFDNNKEFIDQITNLLPALENIELFGGEPFLLKQLSTVLQKAAECGHAEHIRLHFNTNGSKFPSSWMPYFQKFQLVDICFSIDNIGAKFEYERGGSWDEISHNIDLFRQENNINFIFSVMPTVNIQNVLYLDELFTWAETNGHTIQLNMLEYPKHLNIDNMTGAAKKLVIEKYQNHPNPELQKICNRVKNSSGSDGKEFIDYMQQLDKHRRQNFLDSHNEIAIAMGYVYNSNV